MNSRTPGYVPYDIDHEQDVLGFAISDEKARNKILAKLNENDFGDPRHRLIYSIIVIKESKNELVDEISIRQEIEKIGKSNIVNLKYLGVLVDNITSPHGLDKKIELIKDYSNKRITWETSNRLTMAIESNADIATIEKLREKLTKDTENLLGSNIAVGVESENTYIEQEKNLNLNPIVFDGIFEQYKNLIEPTTEAPVSFHYGAIATILGASIGRNAYVDYGGNIYANFYTCLCGSTGTVKKDTAINRARRFLNQHEKLIEVIGTGSAEGLLQCFMEEVEDDKKTSLEPVEGRVVLSTEYEIARLLSKSLQKGSGILETLVQLYDAPDEYSPPTRKNRIVALKPVLSLLTASTQSSIERYLNDDHIQSGFLNRICFFIGESEKVIPFPPKPNVEELKTLRTEIEEILKWVNELENPEIEVSNSAKAVWGLFYHEWQSKLKNSNPLLADIWSRIPNHIWKIALLYAVADKRNEISQDDLELAILVGDYLQKTSAVIVGSLAKSKTTKVEESILKRLIEILPKGLSFNQIHIMVGGRINSIALKKTLDGLSAMRLIKPIKVTGKDNKVRDGYVAIK